MEKLQVMKMLGLGLASSEGQIYRSSCFQLDASAETVRTTAEAASRSQTPTTDTIKVRQLTEAEEQRQTRHKGSWFHSASSRRSLKLLINNH